MARKRKTTLNDGSLDEGATQALAAIVVTTEEPAGPAKVEPQKVEPDKASPEKFNIETQPLPESALEPLLYLDPPPMPRDPLAFTSAPGWAAQRRDAVLSEPIDERGEALLLVLDTIRPTVLTASTPRVPGPPPMDEALSDRPTEPIPDELEADLMEVDAEMESFAGRETLVISAIDLEREMQRRIFLDVRRMAGHLFEDVRNLFEINDREGAIISLERLLVISPITAELQGFLELNEARLIEHYASLLGPFESVPVVVHADGRMPDGYFGMEKVASVVDACDGQRSVDSLFAHVPLGRIEICAILSQLARSKTIKMEPAPA